MFTPRKIADIEAQALSDIEAETGQTTPLLRRAFTRVLVKALAGIIALIERRLLWAYYQIFPQTADAESIAFYEGRYGIVPSPAVAAILAITITGTDGYLAPSGTLWVSASGLVYTQVADATISGTTATAQIECLTPGSNSNLSPASPLSLASPVSGITSSVVVSTVVTGEDADTLDERRAQVLARMRRTDEIGTSGFYVSTALEVSGIVHANVTRNAGGDILVYPLTAITGASRIPDPTLIAAVQTYMTHESRRPLAASISVIAATERLATVTITGATPSDAETKAAIELAISDYFYAAYPSQYSDEPDPTNIINLGSLWAIVVSAGATATGVDLAISGIGSGVTSYTLPVGEIIALDSVVWA